MNDGFALRAVGFVHGDRAVLDDVTLSVSPATRTAIIGPSGAGKSTLLRLLAGLEAPTHGEILFGATVVSRPHEILVPPHRRTVSMVFQDLALWPNLTALDNVVLALSGSDLSDRARRERAAVVLDLVGIGQLATRLPETLSGGEQQRVALARALAPAPEYLFLDEPFASIDLSLKTRLLGEVTRLADDRRFAIILVTHDPLEAVALCDDAVVLEHGRVVERGRLRTLLTAEVPASETLQAFHAQLAAMQHPD